MDGQLQSTLPGANLYLLNPSGVLFRSNATLDISGSFHVSTADVLRFVDGATFSARLGDTSTWTTPPADAQGVGEQAGDAGTVVVQARNVVAAEGAKISS